VIGGRNDFFVKDLAGLCFRQKVLATAPVEPGMIAARTL
jgi:hypothetical protein